MKDNVPEPTTLQKLEKKKVMYERLIEYYSEQLRVLEQTVENYKKVREELQDAIRTQKRRTQEDC